MRARGRKVDVVARPPSVDPLSPAATVIVTPSAAALWQASSMAVIDCAVQLDSGPPQLIEITLGLLAASCTAVVIASRTPGRYWA